MMLLDERSQPAMRDTLAALMSASARADLAIAHLRLAGLNFSEQETTKLERLRLVVGTLDTDALLQRPLHASASLRRLHALATSGRVEVRSVPRFRWAPDFSVFHEHAALVGAHYTVAPYPEDGVALTCVLTRPAAIARCLRRFEQMWQLGYDVLPVITDQLERLLYNTSCA